ncbi:hypothetical protein FRC10_006332 [Ceratobasidium sp. 414]|nr:hypothetical protein FRC10_006332 [Ceratobasidium sp. 414]
MHPESQLTYKPESLLYMRRRLMEQAAYPVEWQGLPPVPKIPYKPFTPEQLGEIKAVAADFPALLALVDFILGYESFGPHQATPNDWERVVRRCCHLVPNLPQRTAGLEHFVRTIDENGPQLPRHFFDTSDPKHYQWDLGYVRAWIDQGAFIHRSGSYMGGPYGFKWLVLLIVHFHSCGSKINLGLGPAYGDVVPEWTNKDKTAVVAAVGQVQENLNRSVVALMKTIIQRKQATNNSGGDGDGSLTWEEEDVAVAVAHRGVDEWTRRNLTVTRGDEGESHGVKRPKKPRQSRKRVRRQADPDEYPWGEGYDADSKKHTSKKRSKSNSSDAGAEPLGAYGTAPQNESRNETCTIQDSSMTPAQLGVRFAK